MQRVVLQGKDQLASEKAVIARKLAEMHYRADAGLQKVIRLTGEAETEVQPSEPIKLLEVNEHTVPAGVMPVSFGPNPVGGIPYPTTIVEVTPEEFAQIQSDELKLPKGWLLAEELPKPAEDTGA